MSRAQITDTRFSAAALSVQDNQPAESSGTTRSAGPQSLQYLQLRQQTTSINISAIPKEKEDNPAELLAAGPAVATAQLSDQQQQKMIAATLLGLSAFSLLGAFFFSTLFTPGLIVASVLGLAALAFGAGHLAFNLKPKGSNNATAESDAESAGEDGAKPSGASQTSLRIYSSSTVVSIGTGANADKKAKKPGDKQADLIDINDAKPADAGASPAGLGGATLAT